MYQSKASRGRLCSSRRCSSRSRSWMRWPPPMISPYPSGAMKSTPSATSGRSSAGLEVERLDARRIAIHHHRAIQILGEQRFVGVAEIAAPLDLAALRLQLFHRVVVAHPRETAPGSLRASRRRAPAPSIPRGDARARGRRRTRPVPRPRASRLRDRRRPSPAPPSRTRSDGGAFSIFRRERSGRSSRSCRTPRRSLRYRAGRIASDRLSRLRSNRLRTAWMVPSQAAGVKIGVSTSTKPCESK